MIKGLSFEVRVHQSFFNFKFEENNIMLYFKEKNLSKTQFNDNLINVNYYMKAYNMPTNRLRIKFSKTALNFGIF